MNVEETWGAVSASQPRLHRFIPSTAETEPSSGYRPRFKRTGISVISPGEDSIVDSDDEKGIIRAITPSTGGEGLNQDEVEQQGPTPPSSYSFPSLSQIIEQREDRMGDEPRLAINRRHQARKSVEPITIWISSSPMASGERGTRAAMEDRDETGRRDETIIEEAEDGLRDVDEDELPPIVQEEERVPDSQLDMGLADQGEEEVLLSTPSASFEALMLELLEKTENQAKGAYTYMGA